jgi:hypothetical protein
MGADFAAKGDSESGGSMSKADQFREYAEETEKERQALIELACTWTQAAVQNKHIFGVNDSPPEHRTR